MSTINIGSPVAQSSSDGYGTETTFAIGNSEDNKKYPISIPEDAANKPIVFESFYEEPGARSFYITVDNSNVKLGEYVLDYAVIKAGPVLSFDLGASVYINFPEPLESPLTGFLYVRY